MVRPDAIDVGAAGRRGRAGREEASQDDETSIASFRTLAEHDRKAIKGIIEAKARLKMAQDQLREDSKAIADRLAADLDDEILATAVGKSGDIESTMLRIVGIVDTGSDEIDAGICQVSLADLERLTGFAGAGEVAIVLKDWKASDATRAALAPTLAGTDLAVWPMATVMPVSRITFLKRSASAWSTTRRRRRPSSARPPSVCGMPRAPAAWARRATRRR